MRGTNSAWAGLRAGLEIRGTRQTLRALGNPILRNNAKSGHPTSGFFVVSRTPLTIVFLFLRRERNYDHAPPVHIVRGCILLCRGDTASPTGESNPNSRRPRRATD